MGVHKNLSGVWHGDRHNLLRIIYTIIMDTLTTTVQRNDMVTQIPLTAMRMWISIVLRHLASCLVQMADFIDTAPGITMTEKIQITSVQADEEEIKEKEIDLKNISNDKVLARERSYSIASTDSGFDRDLEIPDIPTGRDEETGLDLISLEEVGFHNVREDAWLVVFDKVHEMT